MASRLSSLMVITIDISFVHSYSHCFWFSLSFPLCIEKLQTSHIQMASFWGSIRSRNFHCSAQNSEHVKKSVSSSPIQNRFQIRVSSPLIQNRFQIRVSSPPIQNRFQIKFVESSVLNNQFVLCSSSFSPSSPAFI
ncbi:unnamed protein product [Lactuca virosa]|uniref:Uncharacterized protein n=1 Tax=Lactuca virosa TaxID=75947 RepID=A0AAU9NQU0_9ASTR|nr:unnamed protein product [Lactuca virosa]